MSLYEYNTNTQALALNQEIVFIDDLRCGCSVTHCGGSGDAKLNTPGLYVVEFNASLSATKDAGQIVIKARKNGVFVEGAKGIAFSNNNSDVIALSFMFITKVCGCECEIIDFVNTGIPSTCINAACTITKL